MLKCEEAEQDLSAYLDGELTPGDRARLEAHLVLCEKCNAVLTELEQARTSLQKLEHVKAPSGVKGRVLSSIKETPRIAPISPAIAAAELAPHPVPHIVPAPPVPLKPKRMSWTGLLASCAALLLLGLMIYSVSGTLDSHMPPADKSLSNARRNSETEETSSIASGRLENRSLTAPHDEAAIARADNRKSLKPSGVVNTEQPSGLRSSNGPEVAFDRQPAGAEARLPSKQIAENKAGANAFALPKPGVAAKNTPLVVIS